ncbi:MAG: hypothetical protein MI923_25670 [Phycisphaerales bacterium]|nr:hypothetical protein [Phycisphaerales bacterium]
MSVFLDGQPIPGETLTPDICVGQLIESTKERLRGTGVIIFSILCDGDEIPADRLEGTLSKPVSAFDRLELISGRPKELVLDALADTRRSFSDSFVTVKQAANDMTAGNLSKGMAGLIDCIGIWSSVHEVVVQGGTLVGVDFDNLTIDGRHILDWLKDLGTKLRDIKRAIESRDNVLLADMLRYEMDEMMQGWERMLDAFIEEVKQFDESAVNPSTPPVLATT